ncbi:putative L,D-transpeptidase YbiS precursor [Aquimixticola soesokkakensis]|uniref:Putative L,D-transpeptidase YbiS n=1 Tax=Aquimixticola soesokkakensis TaxID=1519096 RepID=A0A1Y5SJ15_9RHOB|nr:L,D-transpeptidase [Aquimixticola soesokkakensis]SLN40758.1 putative L,D-transpeptidase YbiS precursor [Aquimixticola soesokkakensis]
MISRRMLLASGAAAALPLPALAQRAPQTYEIPSRFMPTVVDIQPGFIEGEIHVNPARHYLFLILENQKALRYGVAVGSEGRNFSGSATIKRKVEWPSWTPTKNMIAREPDVYEQFAGGVPGGPDNPLGARALYLYRNGRDTMYRIHGTPQPWTIGTSVSSGCVRMINEHVEDLYERVPLGTRVTVHNTTA